jgi:hypothetical protein
MSATSQLSSLTPFLIALLSLPDVIAAQKYPNSTVIGNLPIPTLTGNLTIQSMCNDEVVYKILDKWSQLSLQNGSSSWDAITWRQLNSTAFSYPYSAYPDIDSSPDRVWIYFGRGAPNTIIGVTKLRTYWEQTTGLFWYSLDETENINGTSPSFWEDTQSGQLRGTAQSTTALLRSSRV